MANVKASGSATLTLVPEIGTFNQYLTWSLGEFFQDYEGDPSTPGAVNPDFTQRPGIVTLYVSSSRAAAGTEIPDKVTFFLNNVEIGSITKGQSSYSKVMSTNTAISAVFELLDPTQNNGNYGLKVKDQLVPLTLGESGQIVAEFIVSQGTSSATLRTDIWFNLSEVTSNSSKVVIEAGDSNNFQIKDGGGTVKLEAKYYIGVTEQLTGLSYEWYAQKYNANPTGGTLKNWDLLATATGKTLTVQEKDVASSQLFMVRVKKDGVFVGQDTQRVDDLSDLYEISIGRTPEDGQVHKATDTVLLECAVYRRKSGTAVTLPTDAQWTFIGTSPAGTAIFNRTTGSLPKTTVTYDEINDAGGQLEVMASVEFSQS